MRILMTGINGLIGSHLLKSLLANGHEVTALSRSGKSKEPVKCLPWDFQSQLDFSKFPNSAFDAVIHLAGEPINQRWSKSAADKIYQSRVESTRFLMESFSQATSLPKVFLTASAIGFYGDRGQEILLEDSGRGTGFLSDVCHDWELASQKHSKNSRTIHLRFGVILSRRGGALGKMLLPFKLGLGGILGTGRQWMSWIDIDDAIKAILLVLNHPSYTGPINIVSLEPTTNQDFTKTLGKVLGRPTFMWVPSPLLKIVLGDMSHLVLDSAKVLPKALCDLGFNFEYRTLKQSLAKNLL